jgi:hypothetical protein
VLDRGTQPRVSFVASYTVGCPAYLPPACEYELEGYEVFEAHRYYGIPGPSAPGSVERLAETAIALAAGLSLAPVY